MARASKRTVLESLTKRRLVELGQRFELGIPTNYGKADFVAGLTSSKKASFRNVLEELTLEELRDACEVADLPRSGTKARLVTRLLGEDAFDGESAEALPLLARVAVERPADAEETRREAAIEEDDETLMPERVAADRSAAVEIESVEVFPRRPRLVWRGMERKQVATFVPTQVVEIVHPGRAMGHKDSLSSMDARAAGPRDEAAPPQNRLIWTNDNLVALQTLLDERDPKTRDYRYRGKVDLVYIDPPFMVNNDFRADNGIDIDIDPDEGVHARKEPSLVEMLAYRDTWREGLDSFLSMLRSRLILLKDLMGPTSSIYVHLDWHAVHYVKILMDEIFGYESLRNEIIWPSTNAHSDANRYGNIHQTLLYYGMGPTTTFNVPRVPYDGAYIQNYFTRSDSVGKFRSGDLTAPGGRGPRYTWKGVTRNWRLTEENMRALEAEGRIFYTSNGIPRRKEYLHELEGTPVQSIWTDDHVRHIVSWTSEGVGYPTQKPVALLERIIQASSRAGDLVLDCFVGSGTTIEAAERLGRRWIGIDNGKYAVHLARKRLIQLHGKTRPVALPQYEYIECEHCHSVERKEKPEKASGSYDVLPFTLENMGVYQRAEAWQDFQTERSRYRDEMLRVFGAEPTNASRLLHGVKGGRWVHVGPLDAPVASSQVWNIAREAQRSDKLKVTILCADFDTLSLADKTEIEDVTGVNVSIRVIPASAIDEVRRRIELLRRNPDVPLESMAVPAFYAPLAISLRTKVSGRQVRVDLARCEVDIESFLASQRPLLKPITQGLKPDARKKAEAAQAKWEARERQLEAWLKKADTWEKFVDFWAIDWDYSREGADGKPIFQTQWQSFRVRKSKSQVEPLIFHAELTFDQPGQHRIAARVTDVFGNDGIATATVDLR